MKTRLTILFTLIASTAFAAPFLVCDMPTTGTMPTEYQVTLPAGQSWMATTVPALKTGQYGFKADITNAPVGTTAISVKACIDDSLWGTQCSEATTYPLVRPSRPAAPGVKIVGQ